MRRAATVEGEFDFWNARLGTEPGATVIRVAQFEPLYRYAALDPLGRENEASLAQWMEIQFLGTEQDPTGGTSGGQPEDYVSFADEAWRPMGAQGGYVLEAPMPPQFARRFQIRMNPKGFGEAESITEKSAPEAVKLAGETFDMALLKQWIEVKSRARVAKAIHAQIDLINAAGDVAPKE